MVHIFPLIRLSSSVCFFTSLKNSEDTHFNQFVSHSDSVAMQVWSSSLHGNVYKYRGIPAKAEKSLPAHCFVTMGKHLQRWAAEINLKVLCFQESCMLSAIVWPAHLKKNRAEQNRIVQLEGIFYQIFATASLPLTGNTRFMCKSKCDVTTQCRWPPTNFTAKIIS